MRRRLRYYAPRNAAQPEGSTVVDRLRLNGCAMIICSLATVVMITGCTTRQAYITGQEWQRNQCNRIVDNVERSRCIEQSNMSYEDYKRQTESLKK